MLRSRFIRDWGLGYSSRSTRPFSPTSFESGGVHRQVAVPVVWDELRFEEGFRADLYVENKVIVELKSQEQVIPVHKKQLLTHIRLADKRLGLLINFGAELIKNGISRVVNGLDE